MAFTLDHFNPFLRHRLNDVIDSSPQNPTVAALCAGIETAITQAADMTALITAVHRLQRLYFATKLDLLDHPGMIEALTDARFILWSDFAALDTTDDKRELLAQLLFEGDPDRGRPVVILSDFSRGIGEKLLARCLNENALPDIYIDDSLFRRRLIRILEKDKIAGYADLAADFYNHSQRSISIRSGNSSVPFFDERASPEKSKIYGDRVNSERRLKNRNAFFTLTELPTPQEAEIENMAYADYMALYFRMIAVDWNQVDAAHRVLIEKLDAGSLLHFTNSDGTNLTMSIEGMSFANSLVAKNIPGSEVFSAPHRDSVNGRIVAKGRFEYRDPEQIMENITLDFKDGRVVGFHADTGHEHLKAIIETDEGSRHVGEIGIGTNPVLKQHVLNSLYVEKIGGSFHVALGRAYEFTNYLGVPVRLDNGNRSAIHWDITTMLVGKQGRMLLDGEEIMHDGMFLDPRLAYLNGDK